MPALRLKRNRTKNPQTHPGASLPKDRGGVDPIKFFIQTQLVTYFITERRGGGRHRPTRLSKTSYHGGDGPPLFSYLFVCTSCAHFVNLCQLEGILQGDSFGRVFSVKGLATISTQLGLPLTVTAALSSPFLLGVYTRIEPCFLKSFFKQIELILTRKYGHWSI